MLSSCQTIILPSSAGVQLQGGHAQRHGVRERGDGLFGPFATAAAVEDGTPASVSGLATAGLALAAMRAAAADAIRTGSMGRSSWDDWTRCWPMTVSTPGKVTCFVRRVGRG